MPADMSVRSRIPMTVNGRRIFAPEQGGRVLDKSWAMSAFLLDATTFSQEQRENRLYSSTKFKFTDTSLGGNLCINPLASFTPYADIHDVGRISTRTKASVTNTKPDNGMGRVYSDMFDDPKQIVFFRVGVPQYNSFTKFWTSFYDGDAATLANTGRMGGIFRTVGKVMGVMLGVAFWPVLVLSMASSFLGLVGRFFFNRPTSSYYTLKPTMLFFWATANTIVNRLTAYEGVYPAILQPASDQRVDQSFKPDPVVIENLSRMMPDIFSGVGGDGSSGAIDLLKVATRAQRLSNLAESIEHYAMQEAGDSIYKNFSGYARKRGQVVLEKPPGSAGIVKAIENWLKTEVSVVPDKDAKQQAVEKDVRAYLDDPPTPDAPSPEPTETIAYQDAEYNDGGQYIGFRVEYTGSVNSSFSNQSSPSEVQNKFNSAVSSARSFNFGMANGNLGDGVVAGLVEGVISAGADILKGALSVFNLEGLVSLAGSAFVDIPNHWTSSSATLPTTSYSFRLEAHAGDYMTRMMSLHVPMACLLAMALPRSTGKHSYSAPYILEYFDRGRSQSRLAMISSISFDVGVGNVGYTVDGHPLAIDVTMQVASLSSIMHVAVSNGLSDDGTGPFDDATTFTDYMAVLAALGIREQIYTVPRLRIALSQKIRQLESLRSPAMWAALKHNYTPLGLQDIFYRGSNAVR